MEAVINPSVFAFMCSCVLGMGTFSFWLVKKIISLTADCHEAMIDVKNAVKDNSEAIKELRSTIINLNHN